jgi:hypothetical protein
LSVRPVASADSLLWFSTVTARAWQAKRYGAGIVDGGDHDRYWHLAEISFLRVMRPL